MNHKQQTAVEWFFSELERMQYFIGNDMLEAYNQAKEIEKQQIMDAHFEGYDSGLCGGQTGDEYYKETYETSN